MHPTLLRELFPEEASIETQYEIDACELMLIAIELVTVNGYPFASIEASGLKGLLKNQMNRPEINGHKVTLNRRIIVQNVQEMADSIRTEIR